MRAKRPEPSSEVKRAKHPGQPLIFAFPVTFHVLGVADHSGIFNEFGSKVTIVNPGDTILRGYDKQIHDRRLQISMTEGIVLKFNAPFH